MKAAWWPAVAALALVVAACASTDSAQQASGPSIVGLWLAEQIAGQPVPGETRVTLSMYGDGRAVGRAGCNNFTTRYERADGSISFEPVAATKMACAADVMRLEQSYLETLAGATRVEWRPNGKLVLTSDQSAQIVFRRQESVVLQNARARGIDFRAAGQEPGWVVELREGGQITANLDYGATTLTLPTPDAETANDGTVRYDASTDTDHLVLSLKRKICSDPMSGDTHAYAVQLMVNEKTYQGCGDRLD